MDTWICVCRKKKGLFSLPQCLHFSACFCQTALVLQVGQCCRTFSETTEIWSICGYSDEGVKYDGKYILPKAVGCDTCVLCSLCPRWSHAGIVGSCDFSRMVVLQFDFRGLSVMGTPGQLEVSFRNL